MINKVKVFRFRVSNSTSKMYNGDTPEQSEYEEITSEEAIEKILNDFLSDKVLISLNVSTIDVAHSTCNRGNTIDLIYTIVYKK